MNGIELYLLGQKLMGISGEALPEDSPLRGLSPTSRLILADVFEHRGTAVRGIVERTGLPEDPVSASVSRLADAGLLETGAIAGDGQRIIVSSALPLPKASGHADAALAVALGVSDVGQIRDFTAILEILARRLNPEAPHNAKEIFDAAYVGTPRWDIGEPQPAFIALAEAGMIQGRVLDVGCGTGEHALMAAGLGLPALGIDRSAAAIEIARHKAAERKLPARFAVHDAFDLGALAEQFDTVLDCGLFHNIDNEDLARYTGSLRDAVPPGGRCFVLCFSDRLPPECGPPPAGFGTPPPAGFGTLRVTQAEITSAFADGWHVDAIELVTIETTGPHALQAWRAAITRI